MTVETKELLELLYAVSDIQWTVFEVHREDFSLRLERKEKSKEDDAQQENTEGTFEETLLSSGENQLGMKRILSPVVGLYHALSGASAVTIGKKVTQGQPVCVIEAMKLMNEIVMPEDGEILFIMAEEGKSVEYGQLLFCYR